MTKIKILIEAYGLDAHGYEGKEIQQEKSISKNEDEDKLTQIDLKKILEIIISSIEEIKSLYPDEQTNVNFNYDNRLISIKFEIMYTDTLGADHTIEEKSFFELVAKYDSLIPLILSYCNVTENGEENTRIMITDEYDEGPPAGTYAILSLVNQNKRWISNYIAFLKTNDLDHEVNQTWDIEGIIEKYGWCQETYDLVIARNVSCCGQAGITQFERLISNGNLEKSLSYEKNRKVFLDSIFKEFQDWKRLKSILDNGTKKYYLKHVVSYAKHFDKILTNVEITNIETFLLQKWDDHNPTK